MGLVLKTKILIDGTTDLEIWNLYFLIMMYRIISLVSLCFRLCRLAAPPALIQYVSPSTQVYGSFIELAGNVFGNVKDRDLSSTFIAYNSVVGETLQLDFGTSKLIRSFYMLH